MKNVNKLLTKCVLIPLGLRAAVSAADAGTHKKSYKDIMKKFKSLEDSGFLLNEVSETIQNEVKKKKKRRVSQYVIRYIRHRFIRKSASR